MWRMYGPLGIDEVAGNIETPAAIAEPVAHGHGTGIDRAIAFFVAFDQQLVLFVPKLVVLLRLRAIGGLDVDRG
jgi:hypothetical protein